MPGWEPLLSPWEQGGLSRERGTVQGLTGSPEARGLSLAPPAPVAPLCSTGHKCSPPFLNHCQTTKTMMEWLILKYLPQVLSLPASAVIKIHGSKS